MNIKQFLLRATACASLFMSTVLQSHMIEQEIALKIMNKELTAHDVILYKNAEYKIGEFHVTTNEKRPDYYDIHYVLEKPVLLFGREIGKDKISINAIEGCEPLYPDQKIKNPDATNDTKYTVYTNCFRTYHEPYNSLIEAAKIGVVLGLNALVIGIMVKSMLNDYNKINKIILDGKEKLESAAYWHNIAITN